ncbi:MAG: bifunctional shikimate kinase/3-dehydroquinate synthase [Gaiellaceae bacterium MAG52_C11]|nr:bifunctional shikimate kinase/3-dehydroquinate synthase [Candidatus Gaiellasilicea maunaloa]
MAPHALDRHIALVGFMGAGKSARGRELAERLGRRFVDVDRKIEADAGASIPQLFAGSGGEMAFRLRECRTVLDALSTADPAVIALGGGAVTNRQVRDALREQACTLLVEVDVEQAWERVRGTDRPLAQDEAEFRERYERRRPLYDEVADGRGSDLEGLVLAAAGIHLEAGALERLGELVPGNGPVEIAADAHVAGIYGMEAQLALGARVRGLHELPPGEDAKSFGTLERLWRELRLDRQGTLVALGGGTTTDAAGFAAATWLRGIDWVAVPTTLVGQVDAAIGGKTAIDLPGGKNLVGAFHWPIRTVIDPALLDTLPDDELANGRAELVKTGLLAGELLWELPLPDAVRRSAAFKAAICLRDPHDRAERAQLNLGHTFAHALEAAADFALPHGRAVALGLLAALRLSGLDTAVVDEQLRPEPVSVDRDRAWAALARDKKAEDGVPKLVLLDAPGTPRLGVELPPEEIRAALDSLIAG